MDNPEEVSVPFTFDPFEVVAFYAHSFSKSLDNPERTMIIMKSGANFSIDCTYDFFSKVFRNHK